MLEIEEACLHKFAMATVGGLQLVVFILGAIAILIGKTRFTRLDNIIIYMVQGKSKA